MKIAFIYPMFHPSVGGIEINMRNIGSALVKKGHKVTILTTNLINGRPISLPEIEYIDGMKVRRFSAFSKFGLEKFAISIKFVSYLLSNHFDIIHIYSYLPYFFTFVAWLISTMKRRIIIYTPTYHPDRRVIYYGILKILMSIFDKFGLIMLKNTKMVFSLTGGEAKYYSRYGINTKIIPPVLNLGIHKSYIDDSDIELFKKRFKINNPILLYVGRMEHKKGVHNLIKAFIKVKEKICNVSLLLVGKKNEYYNILKELCSSIPYSDSIVFTGYLNEKDLETAYTITDLVILPSKFETFGHTIIESWVHKKTIISIETGGPKELITKNEGLLVDYGDIVDLSRKIIYLLENDEIRKNMGLNGYKKYCKLYNPKKILIKINKIYNNMINKI